MKYNKTEVMKMDYCKKCHAPIIWFKTPKGHWMCVDEGLKRYRVNKHGKDRIVTDRGETFACDLLADDDKSIPTGLARTPHWATCPFADEFRREKQKDA